MFNIVVSGDGTSWETDQLMRMDVTRFGELSGSEADSILQDNAISLKALEDVPALLMYERNVKTGPNPELVRYGYAREIKKTGQYIVFRFEEHGHLSRSTIEEFTDRLGMTKFEFNRTHWAIKDGDIPTAALSGMVRLHVGERTQFTVFYAWQSDRPTNSHRRFIREALDKTADRINADRSCPFKVQIDQDTQGVPGLCDIPATILQKIGSADAFVADLTYIATSEPAT